MLIKEPKGYTIGKRYKYFVIYYFPKNRHLTFVSIYGKYMTMRAALQGIKDFKKYYPHVNKKGRFLRIEHVYYE
jgi:hypothetical protein